MSRYAHLDTDAERLPENMERIGYDADTQQYTYRDNSDGSIWEGVPGSRYGILHRAGAATPTRADPLVHSKKNSRFWSKEPSHRTKTAVKAGPPEEVGDDYELDDDVDDPEPESAPALPLRSSTTQYHQPESTDTRRGGAGPSDWASMSPFFVIVGVFLLAVWWFLPRSSSSAGFGIDCGKGAKRYVVREGDTCWGIAEGRGIGLEELRRVNEGRDGEILDCERLAIGRTICVPLTDTEEAG